MGQHRAAKRFPALRGLGQLTLVEHALCPLDPRTSLKGNLSHACRYRYVDPTTGPSTARVLVSSPKGLAARDEFYLWGLLGITFGQLTPSGELYATPHYCLRQLGIIGADSKGGESYRLFREALRRLAAVRYENDRFYDPVRREHREVSFGFFSYSLPSDPESKRAWRIVWDPLFFEICQASGSRLGFDLDAYRQLDPASRRLFLLLRKVFWRRNESPRFELRHLAVDVLGFSPMLDDRTIRAKIKRTANSLCEAGLILENGISGRSWIRKVARDRTVVQFQRGSAFEARADRSWSTAEGESPLHEPLATIGFESQQIQRILRRFSTRQVQVWSDVTLAALEHRGRNFFRRSPQAYFMDNIQKCARGERTCPDWFLALRKAEEGGADPGRRSRSGKDPATVAGFRRAIEGTDAAAVVQEMLASFHERGQR